MDINTKKDLQQSLRAQQNLQEVISVKLEEEINYKGLAYVSDQQPNYNIHQTRGKQGELKTERLTVVMIRS